MVRLTNSLSWKNTGLISVPILTSPPPSPPCLVAPRLQLEAFDQGVPSQGHGREYQTSMFGSPASSIYNPCGLHQGNARGRSEWRR